MQFTQWTVESFQGSVAEVAAFHDLEISTNTKRLWQQKVAIYQDLNISGR